MSWKCVVSRPTHARNQGMRLRGPEGHPGAQELLHSALAGKAPGVSKLVPEYPGAMDTAFAVTQAIERAGPTLGTPGRAPVQLTSAGA